MAEFINTIDILGDDAVIDSIIDRSIREFADDKLTIVGACAFRGCAALKFADLPSLSGLGGEVFSQCSGMVALILRSETMCTLGGTFSSDPFTAGTGYIYVPSALLDTYKAATNWSTYADQFRAIEDYTVDGTVMGTFPRCSGITLDQTALTFDEWATQTLTATISTPSPIGLDTVVWKSADESIARVADGVVTPVAKGSTTITVTCNGHSATCEVVVSMDGLPTLYRLFGSTTFNGTNEYIDTGIQLFDTAKSFTIICEAEFNKLSNAQICLFHCINEASPWPGLSIDGSNGVRICYTGSGSLTTTISDRTAVSVLAIRYVDGVMNAIRYRNTSGDIVTHAVSGTPIYTKVTQNLLLGAYQDTSGNKGRFFPGTIDRFEVYDAALSDEQIAILL